MGLLTQLEADTPQVILTHLLPAQLLLGLGFGQGHDASDEYRHFRITVRRRWCCLGHCQNAAQQIGGSLGTALLNTIATTATAWYFATHPSPVSAQENTTVYGFTVALGVATAILLVTAALMPSRTRWQLGPDH